MLYIYSCISPTVSNGFRSISLHLLDKKHALEMEFDVTITKMLSSSPWFTAGKSELKNIMTAIYTQYWECSVIEVYKSFEENFPWDSKCCNDHLV